MFVGEQKLLLDCRPLVVSRYLKSSGGRTYTARIHGGHPSARRPRRRLLARACSLSGGAGTDLRAAGGQREVRGSVGVVSASYKVQNTREQGVHRPRRTCAHVNYFLEFPRTPRRVFSSDRHLASFPYVRLLFGACSRCVLNARFF